MGGFAAFQDLAYAGTGPIAGWFADHWGYAVVFLIGAAAAAGSLLTATAIDSSAARPVAKEHRS
jgi:MFS family permease